MTLSTRNSYFKGGIFLSALFLFLTIVGAYAAFQAYAEAAVNAGMRPHGTINTLLAALPGGNPSTYVPLLTTIIAVVYALSGIVLIYYFFEKTQAPEVFFFGLFVISLSFELLRIMIPLRELFPFHPMYLMSGTRLMLFARYFGLCSLFASSLYAAGLDAQKQQNTFFILFLFALVVAVRLPIDSLVWDSTFTLWNGYRNMLSLVESALAAITLLTFAIAAYTRASRSYVNIALGIFLVLVGRTMLLTSDTWITPLPGLLALASGTWLVLSRLHREYLWL